MSVPPPDPDPTPSRKPRRWLPAVAIAAVAVLVLAVVVPRTTSGARPSAANPRHPAAARPAQQGEHDEGGEEGEGEDDGGPTKPADYLTLKYTSAEKITQAEVRRGIAQANAVPRTSGQWSLVGPTNVGGRVTDLVVDPRTPNTLYVAASGGGVWRSTDAGATFHTVWPANLTQTLGALAMGGDGTLWAGTGEANPSGGGLTFFGDGVYRSTDGGRHWARWGLADSGAIGKILVDPANPRRVFVAAAGNLSGTAGQRGIYRLDGGHWKLVLKTPNTTTGGVDLAMDPANHNRVYATLWDHKRNNGARVYGGTGSGLYRSDNGGDSWKRLENVDGVASTDKAGTGLKSDASLGRIGVTVAPNDPKRVYVVSGTQYGPDKGFYVSNDGGDSFKPAGHAGGDSGYEWWFGRVWVDPTNENHLFNADVNLRESTDGGQTWHVSDGPHSDQHIMQWDPRHPGRVYLGNDGGVYRSDGNGATDSWIHATYEPFTQSYHLAVAGDDPNRLASGLQDNGSVRTWTATAPPSDLTQWNPYGGGDGHNVLIDYADHNTFYECLQVGSCRRHSDTGGTTTSTTFGKRHSDRITTDAPITLDPSDHDVLYFGGNVLDRSTDQGTTFTAISPPGDELTGPVPPGENDQGPFYGNEYATITTIAPAKTAPKTIYVGTDTGRLWKTTDLGDHWTRLQGNGLPERWVNAVVADPANADHAYAAFSGYREGDGSASVWETADGGKTWKNISGNLPNAPVEMLTYDAPHQTLYASTDLGIFTAPRVGRNWRRVGNGLPNTPILDTRVAPDGRTLYAATFGRSVWRFPLPAR